MTDTKKIAELNDAFRKTFVGGKVVTSRGVADLLSNGLVYRQYQRLMLAVKTFDTFTEDNDPYGEHDFGKITIDGTDYFWKIDYYDKDMDMGSPDPADPAVTTRVLTIMKAEEY
jgi:hypothetical protein